MDLASKLQAKYPEFDQHLIQELLSEGNDQSTLDWLKNTDVDVAYDERDFNEDDDLESDPDFNEALENLSAMFPNTDRASLRNCLKREKDFDRVVEIFWSGLATQTRAPKAPEEKNWREESEKEVKEKEIVEQLLLMKIKEVNDLKARINLYDVTQQRLEAEKELLVMEHQKELKELEKKKKYEQEIWKLEFLRELDGPKKEEYQAEIDRWKKRQEALNRDLDVGVPDWGAPAEAWPRHQKAEMVRYSVDPATLKLVGAGKSSVTIGMRVDPFAKGTFRFAYHATDGTKRLVLKELISGFGDQGRDLDIVEADVQTHLLASHYAKKFNTEKPEGALGVEYGEVGVCKLVIGGRVVQMMGEELLEGRFVKYNNNADFVREEAEPNNGGDNGRSLQAFSHFSYERSGRKLVLCDLQGCFDERKGVYRLTDPACHVVGEKQKFLGESDCGSAGIERFFSAHWCNDICKRMNLPLHPLQPKAK